MRTILMLGKDSRHNVCSTEIHNGRFLLLQDHHKDFILTIIPSDQVPCLLLTITVTVTTK